jgi:phage/plasmid-like protein (TIGR03299 family)
MTFPVGPVRWGDNVPWKDLGKQFEAGASIEQIEDQAGLNWTVEKRPSYVQLRNPDIIRDRGSNFKVVPDVYHLVRTDTEQVLSTVGKSYEPTQNHEALEYFRNFADAAKVYVKVAGVMDSGRRVWALLTLHEAFMLPGDDEVRAYILFCSPHISGYSLSAQFTPIRRQCANVMCMGGNLHRHAHFGKFDPEVAQRVIGAARDQFRRFEQQANALAGSRYNEASLQEYFAQVLAPGRYAQAQRAGGAVGITKLFELPRVRDAMRILGTQPGAEAASMLGTWWGAFQAITYQCDYVLGRNADTRLTSSFFGPYRDTKQRAFKLAMQYAGATNG